MTHAMDNLARFPAALEDRIPHRMIAKRAAFRLHRCRSLTTNLRRRVS